MKYTLLPFLLLFLIHCAHSQSNASGYYVTHQNDTLQTQIKLRIGVFGQLTNDFKNSVKIIEDVSDSKEFTADEIKSFGFEYKGTKHAYISKPVEKGANKFLVPVIVGSKTSLYQYNQSTSSGANSISNSQVFYTFQYGDDNYLFLKNILNKKFKSQLKEFYKDNAEAQKLIEEKLKYWLEMQDDLKAILEAVNKS